MVNPLNEHVKARPTGMSDAPREDYKPPKRPYRRGEHMEKNCMTTHTQKNPVFNEGRLPERIKQAMQAGIMTVEDIIQSVRAEPAAVRNMLARMEKLGDLRLRKDARGQAVDVLLAAPKPDTVKEWLDTKPAAAESAEKKPTVAPAMAVDKTAAPVASESPAKKKPVAWKTPIPTAPEASKVLVSEKNTVGQNFQQASQVDRVRAAVQISGAQTLTEVAQATGLTRTQVSKAISLLISRKEFRDMPMRNGERCVRLVGPNRAALLDATGKEESVGKEVSQETPDTKAQTPSSEKPEENNPQPDSELDMGDLQGLVSGTMLVLQQSVDLTKTALEHLEQVQSRLSTMDAMAAHYRASQEALQALKKIRQILVA